MELAIRTNRAQVGDDAAGMVARVISQPREPPRSAPVQARTARSRACCRSVTPSAHPATTMPTLLLRPVTSRFACGEKQSRQHRELVLDTLCLRGITLEQRLPQLR